MADPTDEETRPVDNQPTPGWRNRAACRGVDPDIFYPLSDEDADDARAICSACGVREACLAWALGNREHEGVWGGATERERRRMIRQRRRSA
jgi:WhiB family redox-sensing transcriptional regulator